AFDTIYAEGQRRYVESLSSYARQFLGQMEKPDVDGIDGLSPAISIDQKTTSRNPRSTVGTVTEIHDYLRLLYARVGIPHCPKCGREIAQQSVDQMIDQVLSLPEGTRLQIMAPVVRARKGEHVKLMEDLRKSGFVRVRVDGEIYDTGEPPALDKQKKHTIEVVVDRLVVRPNIKSRLADSLESALSRSGGLALVDAGDLGEFLFSQNYACPDCGVSIEELAPRMFSFNSPFGACPTCSGLGVLQKIDPDAIFSDKRRSLRDGAIAVSGWNGAKDADSMAGMYLNALAEKYDFSLDTPVEELPKRVMDILMYGTKGEKLTIQYQRERGSGTFQTTF
ncbi:MAG TPA: excinuclease ABC subunit UvrA, partial [Clostridia bacterium]|nr:excinuclease ABC subunit UvrA [Clostridia bacterium]